MVIGHPEGRIIEKAINRVCSFLGGGYHISGLCFPDGNRYTVGYHRTLVHSPDAKLTAAWASIPLANGGHTTVPIQRYKLLGFGYRSNKQDEAQ